jgi:3-isopropylmalate/(R)-2-methylmalate dehydratase large subunit
MTRPTTLFEKIWQRHVVREETPDTPAVLYIGLQLLHEVTSPQAFDELKRRGLRVRRPARCLATIDHSTPTTPPDPDGTQTVPNTVSSCTAGTARTAASFTSWARSWARRSRA